MHRPRMTRRKLNVAIVGAGMGGLAAAAALARYEATRTERTSCMQLTSRQNAWGKGATETDWVYGYNAWTAPLSGALSGIR